MGDIRELETFLTFPWKDGGEIRCALKDAGQGPAVDLRGYKRGWKKLADGTWDQLPASAPLRPGKEGLWIPLEHAESLADALPMAVIRGLELRSLGGYAADGGPTGPDWSKLEEAPARTWNCADCGRDNLSTSRNCSCGARKRVGVSA